MVVARLMKHGKKSTAQRILSDAFGLISERTGADALEVFETAVRNATPLVEVRAGAGHRHGPPLAGQLLARP